MSTPNEIKWPLLLVTGLGTLVFLLLADVVFVTFYGQLVNPGQEQAFYDKFALDTASAFVFCFAPFPLYIITRWICDKAGDHFYQNALLYFAAIHLFDFVLITSMGALNSVLLPTYWLNVASKLAGILAGAYFASRALEKRRTIDIHT